jgi:hypothetical protein
MNESALVAKVAASTPSANTGACTACPTAGLPILLTRYAIVPDALKNLTLPAECNTPYLDPADAKKIKLTKTHYALQTLRAGFVYLYYEVPDSGQWRWFCYMVSPHGMLREIPIATAGPMQPAEIVCTRESHNVKAAIIALPTPEKIHKVYLAYSELYWSRKTRERYGAALLGGKEAKLKQRFVEFSPSAWMGSLKQPGAMTHGQGHNQIAEYYDGWLKPQMAEGYFEYFPRTDQYLSLRKHMDAMNAGKGLVIALPDPIGCATELNMARLKVYKDYADYVGNPEVAWKLQTSITIDGLREMMKTQAKAKVEAEAKVNADKPYQYNPRRGRQSSKAEKLERETTSKIDDLEDHYKEDERQTFLREYKKRAEEAKVIVEALDADYASWIDSESFACVTQDYAPNDFWDGQARAEMTNRALSGGAITDKSRALWKAMLEREPTDPRHYALRGIFLNQDKWLQAFKSAEPKTVGEHFADQDSLKKLYEMARNSVESKEGEELLEHAHTQLTQHTAPLMTTMNGAIAAVTGEIRQKVGAGYTEASAAAHRAMSDATQHLDRLQVKLGLAYGHVALGLSVVILKIDLTVDQWRQAVLSDLSRNLTQATSEASHRFASLALAAQLRVPPGSAMANTLIPFTFWVADKGDKLVKTLAEIFGTSVEVLTGAVSKTAKAGTGVVRGAVDALPGVMHGIRIVGHNLAVGTQVLARIPRQLIASEATAAAARLTRHGMTALKSPDVGLSGIALGFQIYSLKTAIDDFGKESGWKHRDAAWAIGSASFGVAGATADIYGRVATAIRGEDARVFFGRMAARTLIKVGGYLGAADSFVEGIQASIRVATFVKQGDTNAAGWTTLAALGTFIMGGAAVWSLTSGSVALLSATTLLGPVGLLILSIGLVLFFSYMAFMALDKPVQIWLDRCSFGTHERSEGKFASLRHEQEALELVGQQLTVELEWQDTPLNPANDDLLITLRRPHGRNDAVLYGFVVSGPGGQRRSKTRIQGVPPTTPLPRPAALMDAPNTIPLFKHPEINHLDDESSIKVTGEKDAQVVAIDDCWQVNSDLFNAAEVYVRYFPDAKKLDEYYDDMLQVKD